MARGGLNAALLALLAGARRVVPGLNGSLLAPAGSAAPPPWHAAERLAELRQALLHQHPEAGRQHAALRGWGLLVWQPIYVSLIALHRHGLRVEPDCLCLQRRQAQPVGFGLLDHRPAAAGAEAGVRTLAPRLADGLARLLAAWQAHSGLGRTPARRTCADCVLAALLALQRSGGWSLDDTDRWGRQWLDALGLSGEGGTFRYADRQGRVQLALARRGCCLHYRCREGTRCATCPGRPLAERVACLRGDDGTAQ